MRTTKARNPLATNRPLLTEPSAALQIAYLQRQDIGFDTGAIERTDFVVPANIDFGRVMDPLEPIAKTRTWESLEKRCNRPRNTTNAAPEKPETILQNDTESLQPTQLAQDSVSIMRGHNQLPEPGPSMLNDSLDTQSSNIPVIKRAVKAMVQPERMTQGDTQLPNVAQTPRLKSTPSALKDANEDGLPDADVVHCQCGDERQDDYMVSQSDGLQ